MDSHNKQANKHQNDTPQAPNDVPSDLNSMDALSQYLKTTAGAREGRAVSAILPVHCGHHCWGARGASHTATRALAS
ncbi:hypothetical protein [Psychrobacter celer]|uniref:hypothetical protein n=1 Tax=Psychrobacter celer TaxID=306572 RepID=UPI003FD36844